MPFLPPNQQRQSTEGKNGILLTTMKRVKINKHQLTLHALMHDEENVKHEAQTL